MNCEKFLPLLEEYFDGAADERASEEIRAHLRACPACARAYDGLEREQEIYRRFQQEIELPANLWAATQARLAAERAPGPSQRPQRLSAWLAAAFAAPRLSPALTAALVLLAVGSTALVMRYAQTRATDPPRMEQAQSHSDASNSAQAIAPMPETAAPATLQSARMIAETVTASENAPTESSALSAPERIQARAGNRSRPATARAVSLSEPLRPASPEELVREAARTYEAAIAILQRDAEQRRAQLDADTRERFDRALAAIDRTIADTRRAVRDNPGDPVAARYMQAAYVRKIEVLREITDY